MANIERVEQRYVTLLSSDFDLLNQEQKDFSKQTNDYSLLVKIVLGNEGIRLINIDKKLASGYLCNVVVK